MDDWRVQLLGDMHSDSWELSVVHKDNRHGQASWGWFNERKHLVSHNGGPCHWRIHPILVDKLMQIAKELELFLNKQGR